MRGALAGVPDPVYCKLRMQLEALDQRDGDFAPDLAVGPDCLALADSPVVPLRARVPQAKEGLQKSELALSRAGARLLLVAASLPPRMRTTTETRF